MTGPTLYQPGAADSADRLSTVGPLTAKPAQDIAMNLKDRIAATVKVARAEREAQIQDAAERASAERRDTLQKAKTALLSLLTDDVLDSVIGKHAGFGELHVGTIKVTKHGVELIRVGGPGAVHLSGDRLDLKFDGIILQAGQQLQSLEFQSRVIELQASGIKIEGVYDASAQGLLITFDYEKALY